VIEASRYCWLRQEGNPGSIGTFPTLGGKARCLVQLWCTAKKLYPELTVTRAFGSLGVLGADL
jgi:hypothetical protein